MSGAAASGFWEGKVFKLREFNCAPAQGTVNSIDFTQNMRCITLRYVLPAAAAHLTPKDLLVELSSWELRVRCRLPGPSAIVGTEPGSHALDTQLSPLCGDLHGDVRRDLSWWTFESDENGNSILIVELTKKSHKAWSSVWKVGVHPRRQAVLGSLGAPAAKALVKKAEDMLVQVKPGRPCSNRCDAFFMGRETLCAGMDDGQDADTVGIRIHFRREALDRALQTVSLGSLFGVDVMESYLKVFIRGDERSPILMGQLGGRCIPHMTRWEIVKAEPFEETDGSVAPRSLRPDARPQLMSCLEITLAKLVAGEEWPVIVDENEHALARGCAPEMLEEVQEKTERCQSPDRSGWAPDDHAKENKAKGDVCFKQNDWRNAVVFYTRAINHAPSDEKLYSNRSGCYAKMKKFEKALQDANKCVSLNDMWPKAYFRKGQALRGLYRWDDAINTFKEGRFRDALNPEWDKEITRTDEERSKVQGCSQEDRRLTREADLVSELNESTLAAQTKALVSASGKAVKDGRSHKEAGEIAMQESLRVKQQVHEAAANKIAAMVEDDGENACPPPYRIVREDGSVHERSFVYTEHGMYYQGMTVMNLDREPTNPVWIEIYHPGRLRWTQGCAQLKLKVHIPENIVAADLVVNLTTHRLYIGTLGNSDPILIGDFERQVDPEGENFSWYLVPDEQPPMLEVCVDKDHAEVYTTNSYSTLLWPRLFKDDLPLGEGLFEADCTDLPPHLLEKFRREIASQRKDSEVNRHRRSMMTPEEITEETHRTWNEDLAKRKIPHRLPTFEEKMLFKK